MANDKCEIQVDNFIKIGNSVGQVTVQTTYYFVILTDETGKKLLPFVLCKCNINKQ